MTSFKYTPHGKLAAVVGSRSHLLRVIGWIIFSVACIVTCVGARTVAPTNLMLQRDGFGE